MGKIVFGLSNIFLKNKNVVAHFFQHVALSHIENLLKEHNVIIMRQYFTKIWSKYTITLEYKILTHQFLLPLFLFFHSHANQSSHYSLKQQPETTRYI